MHSEVLTISLPSGSSFDMILVEGGEFLMGGQERKDARIVKVNSFYLGKYQVTQALWQAIMGYNPSRFNGDNRPVEKVSWNDTQDFIKKLNHVIPEEDLQFCLPTEAEWEFAARGGIYSQGYDYCGSDKLKQVGWYFENSNSKTHDVGLLLANELGLYDMSGNVREWCEDDFHSDLSGVPPDGSALIDSPNRGVLRVLRGGGYWSNDNHCSSAYRFYRPPGDRATDYGFRLAASLQSVG